MADKKLSALWERLRSSLWLIPLVMILMGAGLAAALLSLDAGHGKEDEIRAWWMNAGDGQDAIGLLSALLTGVISMAAMAFSAVVVVLTLAARQYGPRLVRVFRADRITQATLGTFSMTIVFLVLVLRSVRNDAEFHDVPHASVSLGTALAIACVLALLAFMQGVARVSVADDVVKRVGHELDRAIARLPAAEASGREPAEPDEEGLLPDWSGAGRVAQREEGYVQAIDHEGLLGWAERHDAVIRLDFRAGDFVAAGDRRILVHPGTALAAAEAEAICEFAMVGAERTATQDLEFAIRHLVEVAVRALSPGTNDPFTAIAVIDRLRGCLTRLAASRLPSPVLRDATGRPRILRETSTFAGLVDASFHQIRQSGAGHPAVMIHLLEAIARLGEHARDAGQRSALARHARMVAEAGQRGAAEPNDRRDIEHSLARALRLVTEGAEGPAPRGEEASSMALADAGSNGAGRRLLG